MPSLACLDGEIMPPESARVPISDRGFLFGDAVYEVIRLYRGRCWLEAEHMARLRTSLEMIRIVGVDRDRLKARVIETIARSGVDEGTAYIHITRGVAPRAHAFPDPPVPPTELIVVRPLDDAEAAAKRAAGVAVVAHPDLRWRYCNIKSTNLLANVLALQAAREAGADEALLIRPDGRVSEATHTSVLWARRGRLEGTPEGPGILPGLTRRIVRELARDEGLEFAEAELTPAELAEADEVLLVGTTVEVLPVVRIDDRVVSGGRPGPITLRLQAAYRRAVDGWLAAVLANGARQPPDASTAGGSSKC